MHSTVHAVALRIVAFQKQNVAHIHMVLVSQGQVQQHCCCTAHHDDGLAVWSARWLATGSDIAIQGPATAAGGSTSSSSVTAGLVVTMIPPRLLSCAAQLMLGRCQQDSQ